MGFNPAEAIRDNVHLRLDAEMGNAIQIGKLIALLETFEPPQVWEGRVDFGVTLTKFNEVMPGAFYALMRRGDPVHILDRPCRVRDVASFERTMPVDGYRKEVHLKLKVQLSVLSHYLP